MISPVCRSLLIHLFPFIPSNSGGFWGDRGVKVRRISGPLFFFDPIDFSFDSIGSPFPVDAILLVDFRLILRPMFISAALAFRSNVGRLPTHIQPTSIRLYKFIQIHHFP